MALNFPSNPVNGESYQSGSSATYLYNGTHWIIPSGQSGTSGTSGNQGPQGNQGVQGTTGSIGVQGAHGPQGNQGTQGAQGNQGTQGAQGNQGSNGTSGIYLNSASFATTGSNTFTGTNTFNDLVTLAASSGDEGGELLLAKSQTNNSLTGSGITIDSYQNKLRIFEQGGAARGVSIDLTKTPTGVAGELLWKASGYVNAGTYITLDNLKATVPTSGNRGLLLVAVSSTFTANIGANYIVTAGGTNGGAGVVTITTTTSSSIFNWNFTGQADTSMYIISDITNNRVYRINLMIGGSYNNNFISIERLY